jgi:hypothetical protein
VHHLFLIERPVYFAGYNCGRCRGFLLVRFSCSRKCNNPNPGQVFREHENLTSTPADYAHKSAAMVNSQTNPHIISQSVGVPAGSEVQLETVWYPASLIWRLALKAVERLASQGTIFSLPCDSHGISSISALAWSQCLLNCKDTKLQHFMLQPADANTQL